MSQAKYNKNVKNFENRHSAIIAHSPVRDPNSGFVLLSVTVLVLAVSLVTLGIMRYSLTTARLDQALFHRTEFKLLAEGVTELVIYDLFADPNFDVSDSARTKTLGGRTFIADLVHQDGLVDLNLGSEELISAAFRYTGATDQEALEIAAAIIDWRDSDAITRTNGAEAFEYQTAGLSYLPRDSAMETLGEVFQILPMTRDRFLCAYSLITIYSDVATIDFDVAPQSARDMYAWADSVNWAGQAWMAPTSAGSSQVVRSDGSGSSLRITVRETGADASPLIYSSVIRLVQTPIAPFEVLAFELRGEETPASGCDP